MAPPINKNQNNTTVLYRSVGQKIFYPVLNEEYATQIARDWNTRDSASGYIGYVTRFQVQSDFLKRYIIQTVGGYQHQEY